MINKDWVPIRFYWEDRRPMVEWCYLGHRRFVEPFFEETIGQCMRHPFNLLFRQQTPVEVLLDQSRKNPGLPPTGFIFHMSRCGSTLVAQMLAALRKNIVLSEASPIDDILNATRNGSTANDSQRMEWLKAMVSVLGQKRNPAEQHVFIKWDCWHTGDLPLIRETFPQTPWIFLYRDPIEVMSSQIRKRGSHLVSSMVDCSRFGISPIEATSMSPEEYAARVLGNVVQSAVEHRSVAGGMYVNYRQLPQAVTNSISAHFGIELSDADIARMNQVSEFDAKNPQLYFTKPDVNESDAIITNTRKWLTPLYDELEAMSHSGLGFESPSLSSI